MRVKVDIEKRVVYLFDEGPLSGRELVQVIREEGVRGPIYLPDWTIYVYTQHEEEEEAPSVQEFKDISPVDSTLGDHVNIVCQAGEYLMTLKEFHGPKQEERKRPPIGF